MKERERKEEQSITRLPISREHARNLFPRDAPLLCRCINVVSSRNDFLIYPIGHNLCTSPLIPSYTFFFYIRFLFLLPPFLGWQHMLCSPENQNALILNKKCSKQCEKAPYQNDTDKKKEENISRRKTEIKYETQTTSNEKSEESVNNDNKKIVQLKTEEKKVAWDVEIDVFEASSDDETRWLFTKVFRCCLDSLQKLDDWDITFPRICMRKKRRLQQRLNLFRKKMWEIRISEQDDCEEDEFSFKMKPLVPKPYCCKLKKWQAFYLKEH